MAEQRRYRHGAETPDAPQPADEITIDLAELCFRLLASWKMIVCLAIVFALAFGAYTHYMVTPMYRATSTIYVLNRTDTAISVADLNLGAELAADYLKVFTIWEIHEEVISNLDLPYSYSQMAAMLSVKNDSHTRMLDISIESANPEEAAAIANEYATVVSKYVEETMAIERPSMMSVARVPSNPVSPNLPRNILLGFLLGGVLAVAIVTVRMLLDDKYRTAEDIRRYTGLVNLAVVPIDETESAGQKGAKRR